jgi:hypothetical protein
VLAHHLPAARAVRGDPVSGYTPQVEVEIERLRAEVERLMEGMELAWGLIANGQYWDRTDGRRYGEWNAARAKWRDEHWHPALDRNKAGSS